MENDSSLARYSHSLSQSDGTRKSDRSTPKTVSWLVAALALLAGSLSAAFAKSTVHISATSEPAQTAVFKARFV
jgi:hypothetical protein